MGNVFVTDEVTDNVGGPHDLSYRFHPGTRTLYVAMAITDHSSGETIAELFDRDCENDPDDIDYTIARVYENPEYAGPDNANGWEEGEFINNAGHYDVLVPKDSVPIIGYFIHKYHFEGELRVTDYNDSPYSLE